MTFTHDLATDRLTFGPGAADLPGLPPLSIFTDGASFAEAVETEGSEIRAESLAAAALADDGRGGPYRLRYGLRLKATRLVSVEETGLCHTDAAGRAAMVRGLLRLETGPASDTVSPPLRARADLVAALLDDVAQAQRLRRPLTLVVGVIAPEAGFLPVQDRLRSVLRRQDRLVSFGADRFALVVPACALEQAPTLVARIRGVLGEAVEALGAATAPDEAVDAPGLLRRAEAALAGPPAARPERPGTALDAILAALNGRSLDIALSSACDASGGAVFRSAVAGFAEGARFRPVGDLAAAGERLGLSELVDARLLERICDHLAAHRGERIAWRPSRAFLRSPELLFHVAAHLGARPGIESRLIVAAPEEVWAEPRGRGRLDALKALGVATMATGFGQGALAPRQLRTLPLDLVALDPRLVQVVDRSVEDRFLLRRVIDAAQHLGLAIVAEGVAERSAADLVLGWGVDAVEGPVCGPLAARAQPLPRSLGARVA